MSLPHPSVLSQPQQGFDLQSDSSVVMPVLIGKFPSPEVSVSEQIDLPAAGRSTD
ncbi:hypothetical protein X761_17285 [Mesorhizobium sp. LSHC424B00]|nr:hypothetical protein X761_17285 [Mesorhizobium sp. LSHC424B00]